MNRKGQSERVKWRGKNGRREWKKETVENRVKEKKRRKLCLGQELVGNEWEIGMERLNEVNGGFRIKGRNGEIKNIKNRIWGSRMKGMGEGKVKEGNREG